MKVYIFDKDNTLFHADRLKNGAKEWTDKEILGDRQSITLHTFSCIGRYSYVYISTASNEKYRDATCKLMNKNGIVMSSSNLFMRSEEDKKLPNEEVKRKNLHKIKALHPEGTEFVVFDDCPKCIAMYKEEGCTTCLVSLNG